jgi:hypothetical protein
MPPPAGWRLEAGLNNTHQQARATAQAARMLFGQYEDATVDGLGTKRRQKP